MHQTVFRGIKRKHEDRGWVLVVVSQEFCPVGMIAGTNEGRHTEMMWSTHNGKKWIKLAIGKSRGLIAEPNKDFSFEPHPILAYREESPPFLNSICAETNVLCQKKNESFQVWFSCLH